MFDMAAWWNAQTLELRKILELVRQVETKESATALTVTLSKLTATDIYLICETAAIDPGLLIER